jgi:hypothetical protein
VLSGDLTKIDSWRRAIRLEYQLYGNTYRVFALAHPQRNNSAAKCTSNGPAAHQSLHQYPAAALPAVEDRDSIHDGARVRC